MLSDNGKKVKQKFNYHMTLEELNIIFDYVKQHHCMKYEVALLLLLTRGMRPKEMLAINLADFDKDFTRLTWREAKTNKLRVNEPIIPSVSERIKLYICLNKFRLRDGFLFPYYNQKNGRPYMSRAAFHSWFSKMRFKLAEEHISFNDKYPMQYADGRNYNRWRIHPYSFRRFFETYLFINNNFNLALVKEIMEYNSKFDPINHYIKYFHKEEHKAEVLENTFNSLTNLLVKGQKKISEFC